MGIAVLVSWGLAASGYALPPTSLACYRHSPALPTILTGALSIPSRNSPSAQLLSHEIPDQSFPSSRLTTALPCGFTHYPGGPPFSRADSLEAEPIRCLDPLRVDSRDSVTFQGPAFSTKQHTLNQSGNSSPLSASSCVGGISAIAIVRPWCCPTLPVRYFTPVVNEIPNSEA